MKTLKTTALCLLLVAAAGCSRCGPSPSASAEELLPQQGAMAASSGLLGALGQHVAALIERAALVPGGEQLTDLRKQLSAELGFDPLTREGQLSAGLDPDRAAAFVATLPDGAQGRPSWVVALPLSKPDQFVATADKLFQQRSGLPIRAEEPRGEVKIVVFSRTGAPHKLAYAVVRGHGVIARGTDPAAEIAAAAARTKDTSLTANGPWSAAKTLLTEGRTTPGDLLIFAPEESALGSRIAGRPLGGNSSLALSFSATGLQAKVRAGLPEGAALGIGTLFPGGGGELLPLLPRAAPLQARVGMKASEVAPQLERLPLLRTALASLREQAKAKGVDLDRDLFGALQPGLVVSVGTAPGLQISQVIDFGFLDFRAHSPFDFVQLVALAEVANKDRLLLALDAVAQALPQVGAQAVRTGDDWQVNYAAGAGARFGVRAIGGRNVAYLVGGGVTPESLAPSAAAPDSALAGSTGMAAALDLGKLADALRSLPDTTYGSGPSSYIARSLVAQVIEPLKSLRASAQVAPGSGGVVATFNLEIVAPPGAPAQTPRP